MQRVTFSFGYTQLRIIDLRNEFVFNAIEDYIEEFKCITILFPGYPPLAAANIHEKCEFRYAKHFVTDLLYTS